MLSIRVPPFVKLIWLCIVTQLDSTRGFQEGQNAKKSSASFRSGDKEVSIRLVYDPGSPGNWMPIFRRTAVSSSSRMSMPLKTF